MSKEVKEEVGQEKYVPRLKKLYMKKVRPELMKRMGYKNIWQVPRLAKIVINSAVGEAVRDPTYITEAEQTLAKITGQKPIIVKANRNVSAFGLRKGKPIAAKVTLRDDRMYEFLDRFITFAVPRIRDFRGFDPDSFDGRGNYSLGISEQLIFPEIKYDEVKHVIGMDITIVTTAETDDEARALLESLGFPFRRR
ncbi:50S ribosomal protein L5 [candidate division bacterium WOR-3 4484_18]|uniref:Large ribosomal subunit protein uL5 n=1 Tax=candidate division WOR-3 bacterium 4484_18 TaxID=2020626 RepID=A0A257LV26_UNCW3|nr:MAG: 50S ribosomal protein L5 [candidate division bacterium WOR-3 4484_18]